MPRLDPLDPRFGIKYPKPLPQLSPTAKARIATLVFSAVVIAALLGDTPIHAY